MTVRRSLAWSYSGQALNLLIGFGSSVVIARLVTPFEFGIFAFAAALTGLLGLLFSLGLANYIVREETIDTPIIRSVFTVSAAFSFAFFTLLLLSGVAAIRLFDSFQVGEFLVVFAFTPLIQLFEFVPQALATREMRFGTISAITVVRVAVSAALTITLASLGFGHMSFAWAGIAAVSSSTLIYNLIFWNQTVFRPRFVGFRAILAFGFQMASISGLATINTRLGEMILGWWLGLQALGLYSRAGNLAGHIYSTGYGAAVSVFFVKMAADLRQTGEFHQTLYRALSSLLVVLWPVMLGIAVLSGPIVQTLYGARWLGAALPLSFLMVAQFIILGMAMHGQAFILRKETALQTRLETFRAASGLLLFCLGALISLPAAAAARMAETVIAYFLYRPYLNRVIGGDRGKLEGLYLESLAISVIAVLPCFALMAWTGFSPSTNLLWVAVGLCLGILGWAAALIFIRHPLLEELQRLRQQ
jgi:O-antigen/teichoic acid export membrane protein